MTTSPISRFPSRSTSGMLLLPSDDQINHSRNFQSSLVDLLLTASSNQFHHGPLRSLLLNHQVRHQPHHLDLQLVPQRSPLVYLRVRILQAQGLPRLHLQIIVVRTWLWRYAGRGGRLHERVLIFHERQCGRKLTVRQGLRTGSLQHGFENMHRFGQSTILKF